MVALGASVIPFAQYKKATAGFLAFVVGEIGAVLALGVLSGPVSHDLALGAQILTAIIVPLGVAIAPANASPNSEAISVVDPPLKVAVPPVGVGLTTGDTTTPAAPVGSDALVAELQRRKAALDTAQNDWDNVKAVLGT